MRPAYLRELLLFSGLLATLSLAPALARAASAPKTEIHISLFGQPCILQGPVDERTLRLIHSLSPEQLYPERDAVLAAAPTRKSLEKLRAITGAPAVLDRYRERLGKRLEAQLALLDAIENLRKDKDHKSAAILAAGKANLPARRQKEFEASVKKADSAKTLTKNDVLDPLFDSYSDGIEPDPEEEFHRVIQRMSVQYVCSFEENGEGGGEDGAE